MGACEVHLVPAFGHLRLTFEETDRFLAAAREHLPESYPYAMVSIRTGLRVGEMLALRWADHVRLEQRQLRVELNYTRAGGIGSPKSDKSRRSHWDAVAAPCSATPSPRPL